MTEKENMSFGDWSGVTPEAMKSYSEAKLILAMELNRGGVYDAWARSELTSRQSEKVSNLLMAVEDTTNGVRGEVRRLADTSTTLETLTNTLKNLTWALIIFTVLAVPVPIGIEVWKAFHKH